MLILKRAQLQNLITDARVAFQKTQQDQQPSTQED